MIVDGVTFIENEVSKMTKKDFVATHINVFWLDRSEKDRQKMLSDTYEIIVNPPQKPAEE